MKNNKKNIKNVNKKKTENQLKFSFVKTSASKAKEKPIPQAIHVYHDKAESKEEMEANKKKLKN